MRPGDWDEGLDLCVVRGVAWGGVRAQKFVWQPSAGHTQVAIWPGAMPDAQAVAGTETVTTTDAKELVAGRPWVYVSNVARPTMTIYSPTGKNTGAAVVVFPGGGYEILAIDLEGTEVCDWLTARGITCVLLKYRVPDSGPAYHEDCHCNIHPKAPTALEDAQRTVGLVRFHAAEWHVDPHKIEVLGFSAGGHPGGQYQHALRAACVCGGGCGGQSQLQAGFCCGGLSRAHAGEHDEGI